MTRVSVSVEVHECQGKRTEQFDVVIGSLTEGALRDAVEGVLGNDAGSWLYERYDDAFEEWIDIVEDECLEDTDVSLRVSERDGVPSPEAELEDLVNNLAAVEDNMQHLAARINGDDIATESGDVPRLRTSGGGSTTMRRVESVLLSGCPDLELDVDSDQRTCPCTPNNQACPHGGGGDTTTHGTNDHDDWIMSPASHSAKCKIDEYDLHSHVVSAEEAYSMYTTSQACSDMPSVFFVDVRGKSEAQATGMIKGAIHANKAFLEWHTSPLNPLFLPPLLSGVPLVLYAAGNVTEGGRPVHAAQTLLHMGITNLYVLKEGIVRWKALGYPVGEEGRYPLVRAVVKLRHTVTDMVLEARQSTKFVSVKEGEELLGVPGIVFVDVRSIEEIEETGVIAGAAVATRELIEWYSDPQSQSHHKLFNPLLASGKKLIVYGGGILGGGRPILVSATLKKILPYHSNVSVLEGGFTAWLAAGLASEPIDTTVKREQLPASSCHLHSIATFYPRKSPSPETESSASCTSRDKGSNTSGSVGASTIPDERDDFHRDVHQSCA